MGDKEIYKIGEERAFYINTCSRTDSYFTGVYHWGPYDRITTGLERRLCLPMSGNRYSKHWISWGEDRTDMDIKHKKSIVGVFKCRLLTMKDEGQAALYLWELCNA